jgi:hypothetical protein
MARRPKGTIVRPLPDWNLRNMGFGQIVGGANANLSENLGLYNDSTIGEALVIWDVTINVAVRTAGVVSQPNVAGQLQPGGTNLNGLSQPVLTPAIGQGQAIPGQLWDDANAPGLSFAQYTFLLDAGQWRWMHDWPFAVIPPAWSYVWYIVGSSQGMSVSVYAEAVRSPY